MIEVNPRASRTMPFVSKAIGRPLAKLAALVMAGKTLDELGFTEEIWPRHYSVKEAVFPFVKFPGADTLLGPEMKSTGEVMGIDSDFGRAYAKAQIQAGNSLPTTARCSSRSSEGGPSPHLRGGARPGRAGLPGDWRRRARPRDGLESVSGVAVETVPKVGRGGPGRARHRAADRIRRQVDLVINTVGSDPTAVRDSASIRRTALLRNVSLLHDRLAGARAAVGAIRAPARVDRRSHAPRDPRDLGTVTS